MLKRYTNNIDFDLYRNAADKLGISFVPILGESEPFGYFLLGRKRLYLQRNKLGVNNSVSSAIARNKNRTYRILEHFHLPCPRAVVLMSNGSLEHVSGEIKALRKPYVVKPLRGSLGKGVSVKLNGSDQVADAIQFARKTHNSVLIEEFIAGTNYRVTVFQDKVLDILERIPAYVIGDGTSTVQQLIDQKNETRQVFGLKPIRIDQELKRFIKDHDVALSAVPARGKRIDLRLNCNMGAGGEARRIDLRRDVHPDNLRMFADATREIGLTLAGIDFITPDLSRSWRSVRCAINEINRAPMLDIHYFADFAMNNVVGEKILGRLQRAFK